MLTRSPGVALIRDELVGFVQGFDMYRGGRGGDRARWLGIWSGDPQKIDRKGADPIIVDEPAVSLYGGVQPDVLAELQEEAGRRDGFIERFCWSYADTRPARWTDAIVADTTIDAVTTIYRHLRAGAAGMPVQFHPKARALFTRWVDENADLQERACGLAAGIYAKLPTYAARFSLILHGLTYPVGPASELVSIDTVAGALSVVEYFRQHAGWTLVHFGAAAIIQDSTAIRAYRFLQQHR